MSPDRFAMRYAEWQVATPATPPATYLLPAEATCQTRILGPVSCRVAGCSRFAHTFYTHTHLAFYWEKALTCYPGGRGNPKTPSTTGYRRVAGADAHLLTCYLGMLGARRLDDRLPTRPDVRHGNTSNHAETTV